MPDTALTYQPDVYSTLPKDVEIYKPAKYALGYLQALQLTLPRLVRAYSATAPRYAHTLADISKQISPQMAELQAQLYGQYGPRLNAIGSDIARANALAEAQTQAQVLGGPGRDVAREGVATQRILEPEYFSSRDIASQKLNELLGSINVGGLSGSERAEVERSLARENQARGLGETPTVLSTVSNAATFGSALQAKRNALGQAISSAAQLLPTLRTGVSAFDVASGRSAQPDVGESRFLGVQQGENKVPDLAQSILDPAAKTYQAKLGSSGGDGFSFGLSL